MREISSKQEKEIVEKLIPQEDFVSTPVDRNDRITAQFNLYYEQRGFDPTQITSSFSSLGPQTEEQVYVRRLAVGEEWKDFDFGWIEKPGCLLLENRKKISNSKLTEEEKKAAAQKIIYIRHKEETGNGWAIPVGGFFFVFSSSKEIEIRCLSGQTNAIISVLPG